MFDEHEWTWICDHLKGGFDHLLVATTLPWLLAPGMHHLEAWNEAVCGGAWGGVAARLGERIRQGLDLEHWAAFEGSFSRLSRLLEEVAAGHHGLPPASIVTLSGDVHHAYLAEVAFRRSSGARSAVYQATCSPVRNPLDKRERRVMRAAASRPAELFARGLARAARVRPPGVRWRFAQAPAFDNQVGTLELDRRQALLRLEKTTPGDGSDPRLEVVLERALASPRDVESAAAGRDSREVPTPNR